MKRRAVPLGAATIKKEMRRPDQTPGHTKGRRELVKAANTVLGFHTPIILSPEELAEERWEE